MATAAAWVAVWASCRRAGTGQQGAAEGQAREQQLTPRVGRMEGLGVCSRGVELEWNAQVAAMCGGAFWEAPPNEQMGALVGSCLLLRQMRASLPVLLLPPVPAMLLLLLLVLVQAARRLKRSCRPLVGWIKSWAQGGAVSMMTATTRTHRAAVAGVAASMRAVLPLAASGT